jgi:hypothetical protein
MHCSCVDTSATGPTHQGTAEIDGWLTAGSPSLSGAFRAAPGYSNQRPESVFPNTELVR